MAQEFRHALAGGLLATGAFVLAQSVAAGGMAADDAAAQDAAIQAPGQAPGQPPTTEDETIAASSVLNAPVTYSTLLPLATDAEGWAVIGEGEVGEEIAPVTTSGFPQRFDAIALMPVEGNVRCRSIEATYEDGSMQTIELEREGLLNERQLYQIEFGVDPGHVTALELACGAETPQTAIIAIYGDPAA